MVIIIFVILAYDVNAKRTGKMLRICRRYLKHSQKSVFEGNISEAKLNRLKNDLEHAIVKKEDQILIYKFESLRYTTRDIIGMHEEETNIL